MVNAMLVREAYGLARALGILEGIIPFQDEPDVVSILHEAAREIETAIEAITIESKGCSMPMSSTASWKRWCKDGRRE